MEGRLPGPDATTGVATTKATTTEEGTTTKVTPPAATTAEAALSTSPTTRPERGVTTPEVTAEPAPVSPPMTHRCRRALGGCLPRTCHFNTRSQVAP